MSWPMRADMSLDEMRNCLEVWDQTIGCANCGNAWWGENYTEDITQFHADGCALKGNAEAHNGGDKRATQSPGTTGGERG